MIGKILGGLFGAMMLGPLGLVIGVLIGHVFDRGWAQSLWHSVHRSQGQSAAQQSFFKITFQVMGHIAKVDGVISENELEQARAIMQRLNLNEAQRVAAMHAFSEGKQPGFNLAAAIQELQQVCGQRALLQLFVDLQIRAATFQGNIDPAKERVITLICQRLGFVPINFFNFESFFRAFGQGNFEGFQQQGQGAYGRKQGFTGNLNEAYELLEIKSSASDSEVKKAYRKMMSQNHPDKLVAKGLPPEMIKLATEKTQQIKSAYEQICVARGIN